MSATPELPAALPSSGAAYRRKKTRRDNLLQIHAGQRGGAAFTVKARKTFQSSSGRQRVMCWPSIPTASPVNV